jgi:transposase
MVEPTPAVIGGVDTHLDIHVAAALDPIGGLLGVGEFRTTTAGYQDLLGWLSAFGPVLRVGVEGTGSYGAGLARFLLDHAVEVVEVDRPNRQERARQGKSDPVDAIEAARAAQSGRASGIANSRDGAVEAMRALLVVKRSARNQRISSLVQMRHLVLTAPDDIRARFFGLTKVQLVKQAAALRPRKCSDPVSYATKVALRELARRVEHLNTEITQARRLLGPFVEGTAPGLLALYGVGVEVAAVLLVAAGDNPERIKSEAAFARLCGVAPLEASVTPAQHAGRQIVVFCHLE